MGWGSGGAFVVSINLILAANRSDFVFIFIQPLNLVGPKKGGRPVSTLDSGGGLGD